MFSNNHKYDRKGTAIYVMVLATAVMVSLLGISTLEQMRVERASSELIQDRMKASALAQSAVGLGLRALEENSNWRSDYSNGVVSSPLPIRGDSKSLVYWIVEDSDGNLSDNDTLLTLTGIGRKRNALQVASAQFTTTDEEIGPSLIWSEIGGTNRRDDYLLTNKWWGQHLLPTLPEDAIAWRVDSVELFICRETSGLQFSANLYVPNEDLTPSGLQVDTVTQLTDEMSSLWNWHAFTFNGENWMNPGESICFTLETSQDNPIKLRYRWKNATSANAALLTNDGSGWQVDTDGALLIKINGVYRNGEQAVEIIDGSWRRGDLPE